MPLACHPSLFMLDYTQSIAMYVGWILRHAWPVCFLHSSFMLDLWLPIYDMSLALWDSYVTCLGSWSCVSLCDWCILHALFVTPNVSISHATPPPQSGLCLIYILPSFLVCGSLGNYPLCISPPPQSGLCLIHTSFMLGLWLPGYVYLTRFPGFFMFGSLCMYGPQSLPVWLNIDQANQCPHSQSAR